MNTKHFSLKTKTYIRTSRWSGSRSASEGGGGMWSASRSAFRGGGRLSTSRSTSGGGWWSASRSAYGGGGGRCLVRGGRCLVRDGGLVISVQEVFNAYSTIRIHWIGLLTMQHVLTTIEFVKCSTKFDCLYFSRNTSLMS